MKQHAQQNSKKWGADQLSKLDCPITKSTVFPHHTAGIYKISLYLAEVLLFAFVIAVDVIDKLNRSFASNSVKQTQLQICNSTQSYYSGDSTSAQIESIGIAIRKKRSGHLDP